ncbi:cytochrome C biogenesis protein CcsA [Aliidiomarina minuta]|uniref:Cytochrome C biogenesis protein CcsA n=1 Tax=Aliidiomarina minuta TaxID=880057 RepID=A0A432W1A3_9GAMM|nr:cytochrome-c peroxidase [Aliidiomarina minuta]RUO22977.1 cytochrome C biogenesis protein CcsA [Aliidiomarina minuta]
MKTLSGLLPLLAFFSAPVLADRVANEPIKPIQAVQVDDPEKVALGKKLFFEPRLSRSGFISCNSCHNLSRGGSDNLPTSIGHNWQQGPINSPTVLNSSLSMAQFWDGRAETLQEQAAGPIDNPLEMAFTHTLAVEVLRSIPAYLDLFEGVYNTRDINIDHVTDAIAVFEETLVTPNGRFDQWLKGDDEALTEQELAGYKTFKEIGCAACHYGEAVGGKDFHRMGIVNQYATENPSQGRYEVTGDESDRFSFKVPTLRNVELTYPYFHDGAVWTLEEATEIMAYLQLGRELPEQDIDNMVAFMKTLTGEQPQIQVPQLPPSQPGTPRPIPFEND